MRLVLGTKNPGKLRELFELAKDLPYLKLELAPPEFNPIENGSTFAENALIKAKEAARLSQCLSLGEDSGIAIDVLDGRPGIFSARYCEGSDHDRLKKLLSEMTGVPASNRDAAYHCAMALVSIDGTVLHQAEGIWRGKIILEERGNNGFGYDPVFYLPAKDKTVAELTPQEKNELSHRAQAWHQISAYLTKSVV